MSSWERVADLTQLQPEQPRRIEIDGQAIVLVRDANAIHALAGKCPHAGAPMEQGAVCDGRILCPWHKSAFRLDDGALLEPPALVGLRRYAVRVDGAGGVFVDPHGEAPAHALPPPDEKVETGMIVIVGAGAAGACAAASLREAGFDGEIVLLGDEPGAPYDRTTLSKFVPSGDMAPDDVPALLPDDFFSQQRIRFEHGEVVRLSVPARQITLADGRTFAFDTALLATGGKPKMLRIPGETLDGVCMLRNRRHAATIVQTLQPGNHAVVLGNSFIGLETASALRKRDVRVTVVAPHALPFAKQFGERIGAMFKTLHEENGVVFREGNAARFDGERAFEAVVLDNGERITAHAAIVGVGVRPATAFIEGLTLNDDGGVPVDARMQAAPHLYAAGDIAAFPFDAFDDAHRTVRIEHWRVAQQQARIAAFNLAGHDLRYTQVPLFWTYHYGKRFDYLGHPDRWDDTLMAGSFHDGDGFAALFVRDGRVVGALACNREREAALLLERMGSALDVDTARKILRL